MKVTEYALRFKTSVYVLVVFLIIAGVMSYRSLPLEAAPEVKIPVILVHTLYPGVAPADMEQLVTNVLERELKDLKDVKKMTSTSAESVSLITVEFESGVDLDNAYQKMRDQVDKAKPKLPDDAEEPVLVEINFSEFPMMLVNVSGDYGLAQLKAVAEGLEEKIEGIKGVLGVDLTGGLDREVQVLLDPRKLAYHGVALNLVIRRIQQEHLTTPAGNLHLGASKYAVRIPGEYRDVRRMERLVIKAPSAEPVRLSDLGRVVDGFKERQTISRINGQACVTLRVKKRAGENIVRISDEVRALLAAELPALPAGTSYAVHQDNSDFVKDMVSDLENSIITGLVLVLLVLLFAMGVRNAAFVAVAIPLSMLISFVVLQALGITLNMVVLFSLILALGMLVDNSIVVVENIYRHVTDGEPRVKAALTATKEVAWPIIASTGTTVAVFLPLLFWPGIMGEFMSYLPLTVIVVLCSSLFVALVINPVIAAAFLKAGRRSQFDETGQARGAVMRRYEAALGWGLRHPVIVIALTVGALFGAGALYSTRGNGVEFFPTMTPERAQVKIQASQGTDLEQTDSLMRRVEAMARTEDNTRDVVANVGFGGGPMALGGGGTNHLAVADLEFADRHHRARSTWQTVRALRQKLKGLPGAEVRVEVEKGGPPTGAPVSVEISGDDFGELQRLAAEVKGLLRGVPGVVDLKDDFDGTKPEVRVRVDRAQAMLRKLNTATVAMAVRTAINGTKAAVLRDADEEHDIIVRYEADYRRSINDLLDILVMGADDVQVPLRDVARVETTAGLGSINHIGQRRTILVSSDVTGRSSAEVMSEIQALLPGRVRLPVGYAFHFSGESAEQEESQAFLGRAFMIGVMIMLMILVTQFNSVLRPLLILTSVVMSLIGVLLGLLVTGDKFGIIMTGLGVISLAGVVVNNSIVLIDYATQLREKHGLPLRQALLRAGTVRFRPVLLTAITTVLGLLPMALGVSIDFRALSVDTGAPSMEMWGPMAKAVSFGLAFATVLTLVVVPVMYLAQERGTAWLMDRARGLRRFISPVFPLLLCAVLSVSAPATANAAPTPTPAPRHLDLAQAHSLARANNPSSKTLSERVIQADLLINKAWSMLLPNLSASAAITRNSDEVVLSLPTGAGPPQSVTIQQEWNKRLGLTASVTLFNARSIPLIKNTYDNLKATRLTSRHQRDDLLLSVSSAYYQVHATVELVRTARENLSTASKFEQEAGALRKVGSATQIDTHRARLRVLSAKKALADAEDSVKFARAALATLLGLQADTFTLAPPPPVVAPVGGVEELTRQALRDRLDLRALWLGRRMAGRSRTENWLKYVPVLDVTYNWRYDTAGGFTGKKDTWQATFGARWSLLEGGQRVAAIFERASKHREAENTLRAKVLAVSQEIRQGKLALQKAERNLTLAAKQLELAAETYEMISRQYRAGLTSSLEVVNAGAELEARRTSRVVERLRRDLARLTLQRALGGHG